MNNLNTGQAGQGGLSESLSENLPENVDEAVKIMIQAGLELEGALVEEQRAMEKRDERLFAQSQDKKNRKYLRFDMLAGQMRLRIEAFRAADQGLMDQFIAVQGRIKAQAEQNMAAITTITEQAQAAEMGIKPEDIENYKRELFQEQLNQQLLDLHKGDDTAK